MSEHIVIFGAGGFIGRHLVRRLASQGESIIAVSRSVKDYDTPIAQAVIGDLTTPEQFLPLITRSHTVVHVASRSTPGTSAGHALLELQCNLQPTLAMLEALQQHPSTKLLYLSSGGSLYNPADDTVATETSGVSPRSYHGAGKIAAEYFISSWCQQYGGSATVVRPSNIYGPGQHERDGFGVIPTCLGKILRKESLDIWGSGSNVRDYLYIDDFVDLCMNILSHRPPSGMRIVNAASGTGTSLDDLIHAIEFATGQALTRNYMNSRKVDASRVVMDISKSMYDFRWTPTTDLRKGLGRTWEWFKSIQN